MNLSHSIESNLFISLPIKKFQQFLNFHLPYFSNYIVISHLNIDLYIKIYLFQYIQFKIFKYVLLF